MPPQLVGSLVELRAHEAKYIPRGKGNPSGGWLLTDVTPPNLPGSETILEPLAPGTYFLHSTLTFDQISRQYQWFQFSSTADLLAELRKPANGAHTEIAVLFHSRITRPLAALTLLFLGLPFVLSGADRRMVSLVGVSLAISLSFQLFAHICQRLGNVEAIPPTLAAWLPVLAFGSLAVGMYDLVKT